MRPKKTILCVDDNEQDLSVVKFMLATNGYRVLVATTAPEAIALFADNLVDLVLCDFAMPLMNGDGVIRQLKQIASHVPMALLGNAEKLANLFPAADAIISKTSSALELLERVKTLSVRKRGPRKGALHFSKRQPVTA